MPDFGSLANIATLMVKIKADSSELEGGLKSATDKLNKFSNITLGVGGAITTAFMALIKESVDAGSAMLDMSSRTGVAIEDLSRMSYVAKQIGASSENLEMLMKNLAIRMDDNAQKGDKANDAFTRLGISVLDANGKMKPVTQIMLEISDKMAGVEDSTTKTGIAVDLFGARAGTQLMEMLSLGSEGMKNYMDRADQLGITMSTTQAQAADKLGDSMADVQAAVAGLARSVAEVLIPALQPLIENVIDIIKKIKEWREQHPALFEAISKLAATGGPLLLLVGAVTKVLAVVGTVGGAGGLIGAFTALLPFLGPVGLIAAGVAAVYLVWKNWDKIKEWVGGAWESVKNFASSSWESIKTFSSNAWDSIKGWATNTYDTVKNWATNAGSKISQFSMNAKTWASDFWQKYQAASEAGNKQFYTWLSGAFDKVSGFFGNLRTNSYKWGSELFSSMWDGLKNMWDSVFNWIKGVGESITNFFSNLVDKVKTFFSNIWQKGKELVGLGGEENELIPAYQGGGIVKSTGLAYVHQGETVLPKGVQPVQIQFGDIVFSEPATPADVQMKARDLADMMIDELKRRGIQLA